MLRYHYIDKCECVNGNGWGVSLFIQGCPIHCKGCFNPETWNFEGGKKFTEKEKSQLFDFLSEPHISRCSILGGEPLAPEHVYEVAKLVINIRKKFPNIKIWMWTGYTFDNLWKARNNAMELQFPPYYSSTYIGKIFNHIDYLVTGPFVEEEKDLTLLWRGSRNQEIIDMKQTLATGKKVTYV